MGRGILLPFSLILFFAAFSSGAETGTFTGKVIGIIDGDTLTLAVRGDRVKIKLAGIDAPERKQPFGTKAGKVLGDKVFGEAVEVLSMGKDEGNHSLGVIYLNGDCINTQLVREGLAWHCKQYSDSKILAEAEEKARKEKVGLWADANPVAPWDWRVNPELRTQVATIREYKLVEENDATVVASNFVRKMYEVVVPADITAAQLRVTLIHIAEERARTNPDIDAIAIFAHERKDQIPYNIYTMGMLEWCPNGKWGNVSPEIAKTNSRSGYKYNIQIHKHVTAPRKADRPSEREFQITRHFEDVLYAEMEKDIDVSHEKLERQVAKELGISQKELHDITVKVIMYETR